MHLIFLRHILPSLLSFVVVIQSVMPGAMAVIQGDKFDAAAYLCRVDGTTPSQNKQNEIRALLKALGKDVPTPAVPQKLADQCSHCVVLDPSLLPELISFKTDLWATCKTAHYARSPDFTYFSQGPPLGGRAPPTFI